MTAVEYDGLGRSGLLARCAQLEADLAEALDALADAMVFEDLQPSPSHDSEAWTATLNRVAAVLEKHGRKLPW